jgi:hypothetical protein
MHANHAASRNQPPPVDIPVRSGTAAAPTFAQAPGATASSRGTTSGPGSGSSQVSAGSQSELGRISVRPAELDRKSFPSNRECRFEFHFEPAYTPGQVAHGDHAIVGYTISPSMDDPHHIGQLHVAGVPGSAPHVSQGFGYFVPYNPGQINGVSVPAHPGGGQPTFVFTGGLTGCLPGMSR